MPSQKLTNQIITAALDGFEAQKALIDGQIAELRAMLNGGPVRATAKFQPTTEKKRKMSAAGRKAISEATKKRWAAFHAAKQAERAGRAESAKTNVRRSVQRETVAKPAPPARAAKRRTPAKKAAAKKTARAAAPASAETSA